MARAPEKRHDDPEPEHVHHTVHKYGHMKITEIEFAKKTFFFGLIRPPTSRIYWTRDAETGESVLVREKEERKTTWTELFYDLIFVVVISKLSHGLHVEGHHFDRFVVLFLAVWRIWTGTVYYATRFDTNDLLHKILYYFLMAGILGAGINLPAAFHDGYSEEFVVCFLIAKIVLTLMNLFVVFVNGTGGAPLPQVLISVLTSIPWVVSLFVDSAYSMTCWWFSVILDEVIFLVWPPLSKVFKHFRSPIHIEHITERFGLFIIIVLGENVVASLYSDDVAHYSASLYGASALAIWTTFAMQWIYFDAEGAPKKKHALRRMIVRAVGWGYLHTFLASSLIVSAAGLLGALKACANDKALYPSSRWMLSSGFGAATLFMAIIWLDSKEHRHLINPRLIFGVRVVVSTLLILLPLFSTSLGPLEFIAVVASLVTVIAIITLSGTITLGSESDEVVGKIIRLKKNKKGKSKSDQVAHLV